MNGESVDLFCMNSSTHDRSIVPYWWNWQFDVGYDSIEDSFPNKFDWTWFQNIFLLLSSVSIEPEST